MSITLYKYHKNIIYIKMTFPSLFGAICNTCNIYHDRLEKIGKKYVCLECKNRRKNGI